MSDNQYATAPGGCQEQDNREAAVVCLARSRDASAKRLEEALSRYEEYDAEELEGLLWDTLVLFQGYPFYTAKKLQFTYTLKGHEMFVTRKEKSLTRASIMLAFWKALELGRMASGPKKLGTFGASYLYPVFLHLKVIYHI